MFVLERGVAIFREIVKMWRAGVDVKASTGFDEDDAWETDPDFVVSSFIHAFVRTNFANRQKDLSFCFRPPQPGPSR